MSGAFIALSHRTSRNHPSMTKALCFLAFDTLYCNLTNSSPIPFTSILQLVSEKTSDFPQKAPLFVTWDKNHDLRGCIGTFAPQPIESGVKRFALTAALDDSRFPPITSSELSQLSCDVTVLHNFSPIENAADWVIGTHGLRLSFEKNGVYYSGTFLPSVAPEQGWDKLATLWYLLRKADYSQLKGSTLDFYERGLQEGWMRLETYEGDKYTMEWQEFESLRDI